MTPERLAALHAGGDYRAYMYGFAPAGAILAACRRSLHWRGGPVHAGRRREARLSLAAD